MRPEHKKRKEHKGIKQADEFDSEDEDSLAYDILSTTSVSYAN